MNSQTPSFGLVCPVPAVVNTWEMNQKMVALSVALFISLCLSNDFLNELNHLYLNVKPRFVHLVLFFPPTPYNTLAFPQVTNIYYKTIINTEPQYFQIYLLLRMPCLRILVLMVDVQNILCFSKKKFLQKLNFLSAGS